MRITKQSFRKKCTMRRGDDICSACGLDRVFARGMCKNCYSYEMRHQKINFPPQRFPKLSQYYGQKKQKEAVRAAAKERRGELDGCKTRTDGK